MNEEEAVLIYNYAPHYTGKVIHDMNTSCLLFKGSGVFVFACSHLFLFNYLYKFIWAIVYERHYSISLSQKLAVCGELRLPHSLSANKT